MFNVKLQVGGEKEVLRFYRFSYVFLAIISGLYVTLEVEYRTVIKSLFLKLRMDPR